MLRSPAPSAAGPAATARAVPRRAAAEARAALLPGGVALRSSLPQGARSGASGMFGGGPECPEAPYGLAGASCSWKPRYLLPASRASGGSARVPWILWLCQVYRLRGRAGVQIVSHVPGPLIGHHGQIIILCSSNARIRSKVPC